MLKEIVAWRKVIAEAAASEDQVGPLYVAAAGQGEQQQVVDRQLVRPETLSVFWVSGEDLLVG